jgi:uncharacterized membrane protein
MVRKRLAERGVGLPPDFEFRHRGTEVSRIEGFSDAVFAFAVTLLVVSLQVPRTFGELMDAMRGFAAFAICFAALVRLWYEHYIFFRRYALQDRWTVVINSALLFVILIFVYPLKFLFTLVVAQFTGGHPVQGAADGHVQTAGMITRAELPSLFVLYGLGFIAAHTLFALLHAHAAAQAKTLELTRIELFDVRARIVNKASTAAVGVASVAIACLAPAREAPLFAGLIYGLLPVLHLSLYFGERAKRGRLSVVDSR